MRKQAALTPEQIMGIAETGAYMIPGVGGVLSGRDAFRNVGGMAKALLSGNWGKLGSQGLSFLGNTAMALADFIPGGSIARGALRGAKVGHKGLKAMKLADKLSDISRSGKKLQKARKAMATAYHPLNVAGKGIHRGSQRAMNYFAPGVGRTAEALARRTGLNTYGRMQMAGIAPLVAGGMMESDVSGPIATPRQDPVAPPHKWLPPIQYR